MAVRVLTMLAALAGLVLAATARARTLEELVLAKINAARADPRRYAEELRVYRGYFDGNIVYLPGDYDGLLTREGTAAVDEAIAFLEQQAAMPPLTVAPILAQTALDFSREQGSLGAAGHRAADGSGPGDRVKRHGGDIYVGEAIAFGSSDAEQVVRQMIIDDGVADRGHRRLLFNPRLRFVGIGCAPHRTMEHLCVVDISATPDGRATRVRYAEKP
ncbi:CAP domain-containing protein [Sphingomonas azotifigens]|uniref:CAP domain-containing protein n=1 Tax=Sphingomonas azotifigens TaxID=330920 RepID=UPI0009FEF73F|nr:CAP domain-containing protein [Sphingomonas azotifigens]